MAIAKKHKRTLVYGDSTYYWWVKRDDDYDRPVLHIASEDKGLIVLYPTEQNGERRYLVSIGRVFKNRTTSGCWQRYRMTKLDAGREQDAGQHTAKADERVSEDFPVTPGFVASLLGWCLDEGDAESVTWNGRDIWL